MKKIAILFLSAIVPAVFAAGFNEKFAGNDLPQDTWMQHLLERCSGIDYVKPLNGKLVINGLKNPGKAASAALERDACFTAGNVHWRMEAELGKDTKNGSYNWNLLSDNGERQLGVTLTCTNGKWTLAGIAGHTCSPKNVTVYTAKDSAVKVEIIRKNGAYQLLCNGKCFYTAEGDTATIASIRLTVSGNARMTVKSMSLEKIK